ncbi:Eco57I restriction-modification methylase domain-containing protein [Anabaena azotica]|uniref:type IIG restriction enzyme/methyltransferase n=1 Tax=Anabaena azotica TaxID=197653 RepID=UPI0039A4B671
MYGIFTENDNNSLNKKFYSELLHIIGLTEIQESGKKIIRRKKESERYSGSLIENTLTQPEFLEKISRLENLYQFGDTYQEQIFQIALELIITWINRILFLKFIECQLLKYHKNSTDLKILSWQKIRNFHELNHLFLKTLNSQSTKGNENFKSIFDHIPYLNSSFFEITHLEKLTITISSLNIDKKLSISPTTVLKDNNGNKRTEEINPLEYIFEFLNAYDFNNRGTEEIQTENQTLINASVLGLIFEKLNNYKDASFFTPSFITMYMCRETIRRAIIQKFNQIKGWNCQDIQQLYEKIENKKEANDIINSLKICDPAVGTGHFLVSALNEIIVIKSELKILFNTKYKTLKNYHIEIKNDELIILDYNGQLFEYQPQNPESQHIQKTLFHEKQTIIENCLFGVDINFNSVNICQLRLWMEILKNAYYTEQSHYTQLGILHNIDINIRCGNSLISRFPLDWDFRPILKKNQWIIENYRNAVKRYRCAETKEQKHTMAKLINDIKENIRTEMSNFAPTQIKLKQKKGEMEDLDNQISLFVESDAEKQLYQKKHQRLEKEIHQLSAEIEEIESGQIYQNAFEWRFEFPEVLNNEGDFIGFDVVIGNPPYGLFNKQQNQKIALTTENQAIELIKREYPQTKGGVINAYKVFYCLGIKISKPKGFISMIIPMGILTDITSYNTRRYLLAENSIILIDAFPERDNIKKRIFEDVKMSTTIILTQKGLITKKFSLGISYEKNIQLNNRTKLTFNQLNQLDEELLQIPLLDSISFELLCKCYENPQVIKLKNISPCLTGEVDMTFGKTAITNNPDDQTLVKGVQIDRYILKNKNAEISQGIIQYLNIVTFKQLYNGEKLIHAQQPRIILQGLTGINERRRLKCTIVAGEMYLANSCNYIICNNDNQRIFLLGLLNSRLMNWIFKARSTSSNVNGYEVDNLPIIFPKQEAIFNDVVEKVMQILAIKQNKSNTDTTVVEQEIDQLVYQLYGLTAREIKIVESTTN